MIHNGGVHRTIKHDPDNVSVDPSDVTDPEF